MEQWVERGTVQQAAVPPRVVAGGMRKVADVMRREPTSVEATEELALALQIMLWRGLRHLPVTLEGKVVGVLTERDILMHRDPESPSYEIPGRVADAMRRPATTIPPQAETAEAAARMAVHGIGCLPVVEGERLVGLVTTTDLLAELAQVAVVQADPTEMEVRAVMTRHCFAVMPDDPLLDAAAEMVQNGVRHLPVVDGMRRVIGILSDRDVRCAVGNPLDALEDRRISRRVGAMCVRDAMTAEPRTCRPDEPLANVIAILADGRIGALPVVEDDDRLLGIVSYVDVLRRLA